MDTAHTQLRKDIIGAIKKVYDPEIDIDIYELGLIYAISIDKDHNVHVLMTLTTPNCPAADAIVQQVEAEINALEDVKRTQVELTFTPPYDTSRMSEAAKLDLGLL